MTMRCRDGPSSSRWSAATTTGRETPPSSCRSAARTAAWPSRAASTRGMGGSTPSPWRPASSTRPSATASPWEPTPGGSPCWTTSAGAAPSARNPGIARARRPGLPRPGTGVQDAVHLGQGQSQQRVRPRGQEPGHPADTLDQRDRPGARRPPLRHHGLQGAGKPRGAGRQHPPRAGRLALGGRCKGKREATCPASIPISVSGCSGPSTSAISHGLVRSCHDLSDGGLAVALAEMAIAGGLGAAIHCATSRARTTPRTTSCSCSPSHPAGSCSRFLPSIMPPWLICWAPCRGAAWARSVRAHLDGKPRPRGWPSPGSMDR